MYQYHRAVFTDNIEVVVIQLCIGDRIVGLFPVTYMEYVENWKEKYY